MVERMWAGDGAKLAAPVLVRHPAGPQVEVGRGDGSTLVYINMH